MRKEDINDLASPGTQLLTQPPVNIILTDIEEDNMFTEPPQAELLQWNYRLGYGSFIRLRLLTYLEKIPRKLPKVNPPKCDGCLYGAMKKCPWRTKYAKNRDSIWKASTPGECISVDRMESNTPVFIAQLKGKPTTQC